jgi:hypothetical protein
MKKLITLGLAVIVTASSSVFAASINDRQQNQRARISNGINSGEITRPEAKRMINQQHNIAVKEARFKSDGTFTRRERANVQNSLNKSSANIYRKKHNRADRN